MVLSLPKFIKRSNGPARPGGVWEFAMHGPDGIDYKNKSIYVEVVKPERIVFKHVTDPEFQTTIIFAKQGNDTLITMCMRFDMAAQSDKVIFAPVCSEINAITFVIIRNLIIHKKLHICVN